MGQTGRKTPATWDEIYAFKAKCKAEPELESKETVRQCKTIMEMQAEIYYEREAAGHDIAHDVLMESYTKAPRKEVRAIAKAMGICDAAVEDEALVEFVVQMGKELKSHPDRDMGITQMHDVHTKEQREKKCSNLEAWMREDDDCRAWMDANASHTANAVLRKFQADGGPKKGKKR